MGQLLGAGSVLESKREGADAAALPRSNSAHRKKRSISAQEVEEETGVFEQIPGLAEKDEESGKDASSTDVKVARAD